MRRGVDLLHLTGGRMETDGFEFVAPSALELSAHALQNALATGKR
jgi:hypothetical protein